MKWSFILSAPLTSKIGQTTWKWTHEKYLVPSSIIHPPILAFMFLFVDIVCLFWVSRVVLGDHWLWINEFSSTCAMWSKQSSFLHFVQVREWQVYPYPFRSSSKSYQQLVTSMYQVLFHRNQTSRITTSPVASDVPLFFQSQVKSIILTLTLVPLGSGHLTPSPLPKKNKLKLKHSKIS